MWEKSQVQEEPVATREGKERRIDWPSSISPFSLCRFPFSRPIFCSLMHRQTVYLFVGSTLDDPFIDVVRKWGRLRQWLTQAKKKPLIQRMAKILTTKTGHLLAAFHLDGKKKALASRPLLQDARIERAAR